MGERKMADRSCHDMSDEIWEILKPYLPGSEGVRRVTAKDDSLFINAVLWILRTVTPWRDLPSDFGDCKNTHRSFCRWRDNEVWEELLEMLLGSADTKNVNTKARQTNESNICALHIYGKLYPTDLLFWKTYFRFLSVFCIVPCHIQ